MEEKKKSKSVISIILSGAGVLLLMASGFDVVPAQDNLLCFLGLACFIVSSVLMRISNR